MRSIIAVCWFEHAGHVFGIVVTKNSVEETKAWIGVCAGVDEKKDMVNIANHGAKFPIEAANLVVLRQGEVFDNPIEIPQ